MPSLAPHDPKLGCPRCGGGLRRQQRTTLHRLISIVRPLKYYSCERHCGWSGTLKSRSGIKARNQRIQVGMLIAATVFCLVTGAKILTERITNAASGNSAAK